MAEGKCCGSGTIGLLLTVLVLALNVAGTFNAKWWEKGSGGNITDVHLFQNVDCDEDNRCNLDNENTEVWIRFVQGTSILCLVLTLSSLILQIFNIFALKFIFAAISGGFHIITAIAFMLQGFVLAGVYRKLSVSYWYHRNSYQDRSDVILRFQTLPMGLNLLSGFIASFAAVTMFVHNKWAMKAQLKRKYSLRN
ncbi:hypothetical protein CHS0354_000983 [Potamilus streckersoni]|uniref:Uncharacterized protein n=1 Tax=Potamilus streckersoni TaxID=2493646 RepID=A0AAE0VWA8_9BIVA|nr:hypothetical protein CHS0354_000983 [Potamilus streckersoni]